MTIKELVATKLSESSSVVKSRVLDLLVEEELQKRVKAVSKVISLLNEAKAAGYKLKPDANIVDREGRVITEGYKKETAEAAKKNAERVTKLETALNEALNDTNANYEKVLKLINDKPDLE